MKTYQPISLDKTLALRVWLVIALVVGLLALSLLIRESILAAVLLPVVIFLLVASRADPRRYEITNDAIVIVRRPPFKNIVIPLAELKEIRRVALSRSFSKTLGLGRYSGLFSWTGSYWNKEVGEFSAQSTIWGGTVLVSNGDKYVISPENPEEFIAEVGKIIGR